MNPGKQFKRAVLGIAICIIHYSASSQIVYTNIQPDLTFNKNGDTYNLDVNNDAIIDFTISIYQGVGIEAPPYYCPHYSNKSNNNITVTANGLNRCIQGGPAYAQNVAISSSSSWATPASTQLAYDTYYCGPL